MGDAPSKTTSLNDSACDQLVASCLRAQLWLDEAGHALKAAGFGETGNLLILEANYARTAALDFMGKQNAANLAEVPLDGSSPLTKDQDQ